MTDKLKITTLFMVALMLIVSACKPTPTPSADKVPSLIPSKTPIPATPVPPTDVLSTPTPVETESPPTSEMVFTVLDMVNETTGWALTYTLVVRTIDGGETWTDISPVDWDDSMVPSNGFFLNAEHGWVLQTDAVDFERGVFFHTSDGGATWEKVETPFGAGPITFIDGRSGWVMTGLGAGAGSQAIAIFATRDGGKTWTEVYRRDTGEPEPPGEIPLGGSKQGITFRDALHGWVAGSVPADNITYLYATENGGFNFQQQEIPMPTGIDTAMLSLEAPKFFTQSEGVLPVYVFTADISATVFYTTDDGGLTWTSTAPVPVLGRYSTPTKQDFIVWDGNILYRSGDSGQTWTEIIPDINLDQMVATLEFVDDQNGWVTWMDAEGNFGLNRTLDGGATWMAVLP